MRTATMSWFRYCFLCIVVLHCVPSEGFVYNVSTKDSKPNCVCDENTICIRKCCELNHGIPGSAANCTWYGNPNFVTQITHDSETPPDVCFTYGIMQCGFTFFRLEPRMNADDEYEIKDGVLSTPAIEMAYPYNEFCVEDFEDIGVSAYVCVNEEAVEPGEYYAFGMLISIPFLIVTFVVHALLPVKTMHTKCLMCFVLSLAFAYVFLSSTQFYGGSDMIACLTIGMICVFNFMASFLWTNVMSFDIWLTFSGVGGFGRNRKKSELKRYLMYSAYVWGFGVIHITMIVLLNTFASEDAWYNPLFGFDKCWFRDDMAILLYFYGPLAAIIVINIALFTLTALTIKKTQKDTKVLRQGENKSTDDDQQRFKLYLKLLLAMGGNWSLEVISWAWGWQVGPVPEFLNFVIDLCNVFYGVLIFFMFTFKKTNWIQLQKRFPSLRKIQMPNLCRRGPQQTSESVPLS
ncbi:G-protein coupled receptor Mth2-like [Photinus pyralis]|nr:G-protein coupled receptor Mth2-like [Photinus pyralis]